MSKVCCGALEINSVPHNPCSPRMQFSARVGEPFNACGGFRMAIGDALISNMSNNFTRGGRKPKVDPSVNRYVVRFNAEENARFLAMFEKSEADNKAAFIKHSLFQKPFKVFYVDENTRVFIDRLAGFNSLYRTIGVSYDNLVATLHQNFTEKKALEIIAEIKKLMIRLISVSQDIAALAKEFDEAWSRRSR